MQDAKTAPAIEVKGASKWFRKHLILDQVDLVVPVGRIYGIRGPNGAGKSTLLRVICGLVLLNQGEVRVFGQRIGSEMEFPPATGALIERPGFLPHYSGRQNLQLLAMIRNQIGEGEIAAVLRQVGLDPEDRRPVRTYSTGMKQRLGIAQAIMENPRLLLLDEPTNGLDLDGIREVHHLLKDLKADGVTILLVSHSLEELASLCDDIFMMDKGRLSPYPS